jgi:nicotinate phosphoribosyltransferase
MDLNNYTLLCDFYELTMANGYFQTKYKDTITYFDLFYRKNPDKGGFVICAGLESVIDYIKNLHFFDDDIEYLRSKGCFCEEFLDYLKDFTFTGDIYAVPEGTPVFPYEPIITVRAKAIEAQLIETYLLLAINHQSLIATKASRIVRSALGRPVLEFGSRRAQGTAAAILGSRSAYIAGVTGTACTIAEEQYGVPALGTMAHSWVQMFDTEYEAFETYCKLYPNNVVLLVDTYDVLKSGVPNAIKAIKNILLPLGIKKAGIRIDSGDIAYLSKKAKKMFIEAGLPWVTVCVSNGLDERLISELINQDACVDSFGVGERLITASSDPVFGGVYKLVAIEDEKGDIIPKIKISENEAKITNPHYKKIYRLFEKDTNKAIADVMCLYDEVIDETKPYEIFDPNYTWKRKTVENFYAKPLQVPVFIGGELVYDSPSLQDIRAYSAVEIGKLWEEVKRFDNPHTYYVDLSQSLWDIKHEMLRKGRKGK